MTRLWVKTEGRKRWRNRGDKRSFAPRFFGGKEATGWHTIKDQVDQEFTRWSNSYDRSILQWLLFGPSHRVLIRRIRDVAGDRPLKMLDVGCGTGVFASRVRAALPQVEVCGVDLVSEMLQQGKAPLAAGPRARVPGARRQRTAAV